MGGPVGKVEGCHAAGSLPVNDATRTGNHLPRILRNTRLVGRPALSTERVKRTWIDTAKEGVLTFALTQSLLDGHGSYAWCSL